jgi:hypothetical protein
MHNVQEILPHFQFRFELRNITWIVDLMCSSWRIFILATRHAKFLTHLFYVPENNVRMWLLHLYRNSLYNPGLPKHVRQNRV